MNVVESRMYLNIKEELNLLQSTWGVTRTPFTPTVMYMSADNKGTTVEAALQWTDAYQETVFCFTNNIPQKDGGAHLAGFR